MFKPAKTKLRKVLISFITLIFILFNFSFLFLLTPQKAQAIPVEDIPALIWDTTKAATDKVMDELKSVFFKNVVGTFVNKMAQESAIWIASGAEGDGPMWMSDPEAYLDEFVDAAVGELVYKFMQELTQLDVCNLDPTIALNLALSIPMFPEERYDYDLSVHCTWSEMQNHWEEIGEKELFSFQFDIAEGGTFDQNVRQANLYIENEVMLRTWDIILGEPTSYIIGDFEKSTIGGKLMCSVPPIQNDLILLSNNLELEIDNLREDLTKITNAAGTEAIVNLSTGQSLQINDRNIEYDIRQAWLGKLQTSIDKSDEIITLYNGCVNRTAFEYIEGAAGECLSILGQLNVKAPDPVDVKPDPGDDYLARKQKERLLSAFGTGLKEKIQRVVELANSVKNGYDTLKSRINKTLVGENFETGAPYSFEAAKDIFKPQGTYVNAYEKMVDEMTNEGINAYVNRTVQKMIEGPFDNITNRVAGFIETPGEFLRARSVDALTTDDSVWEYTKSITADALGVFLSTLWNEYMRRLLASLAGPAPEFASRDFTAMQAQQIAEEGEAPLPVFDIYNPYEEETYTPEGARYYVEKLGEQFQVKFSFRDVDLLTDFQLRLTGQVNPNLYNNVIDQNFALAINDKMTIGEALIQGRLVGDHHFSWGEEIVGGTYNLSNLKKLRKARVIPLGLELAAQLVRDCNYRATLDEDGDGQVDYADFSDLTLADPYGYDNPAELLKTQRLKNCLFRPLKEGDNVDEVRNFNIARLNEVKDATLGEVINGYDKIGDGTCGDFDDAESPFCNLVNPNWVLKIPITKCALQVDAEPYNEILVTDQTGQRYSSCPDFSSCLVEDKQGACVNEEYGFCVKEENTWQFGADSCPSQYNSCRTYTYNSASGTEQVSYLKNTLSGDDICGPDNAGCNWYSVQQTDAGLWQADQRIYLNRYTESCDSQEKGCNEFYLYRDFNTNIVTDSGFEDTLENYFPTNWELRIKQKVDSLADCQVMDGVYFQTCLNYNYAEVVGMTETEKRDRCLADGGQWIGSCSDNSASLEQECLSNEFNTWDYDCLGAIKVIVTEDDKNDCEAHGEYYQYCIKDILKYNLCANPQFTVVAECLQNSGRWVEECDIGGQITYPGSDVLCNADGGTWLTYCDGAKIYDSDKNSCSNLGGIWRGYGPFSDLASVSKDGLFVRDGLSKLKINISTLSEGEELQLRYISKFAEPDKKLAKPGDIYTASAYLKTDEYLTQPITFSLIGGTNDISSSELNLVDDYYYQTAGTIVTGLNGSEQLAIQINIKGGECEAEDRDIDKGVLTEACIIGGEMFTGVSQEDCDAQSGQMQKVCLRDKGDIYVYLDTLRMSLNSLAQIRSNDFVASYSAYSDNDAYYYKKPPADLNCRGYVPGDPSPILSNYKTEDACEFNGGFWDQPTPLQPAVFDPDRLEGVCYLYPPDNPLCSDYMKVCEDDEVGCQVYTPQNGEPSVPGVISTTDICPAECVGYDTYKQQPVIYEPEPEPLYNYFIPETATRCNASDVGCAEFTNLGRKLAIGESLGTQTALERIEYYTYLRQCVSPGEGAAEKTYFTWQGSSSGPPQLIKYVFEEDSETGAPKMIDDTGDCRVTLGEDNFNCIKLYDSLGNIYYRDIRMTVVVSEECVTFRKTESTQENCDKTNGRWQAATGSCLYDGVPSQSNPCSELAEGCRAYIGNQGNNIYVSMFDNFEGADALEWYEGKTGFETGNLQKVGESVVVGGHSLLVADNNTAIHKFVNIEQDNLYTLSFWAKAETAGDKIKIAFDTALPDTDLTTLEEFASLSKCSDIAYTDKVSCVANGHDWIDTASIIELTTDWQNYTLGPVYVSWQDVSNNSLVFEDLNSNIYLDNITLKVVKDNVYVIKNSWTTPESCDVNFFGAYEKGAMLGCQSYADTIGQIHYFKSFTNLCRESVIGCQLLIDTKNSSKSNEQMYNMTNISPLDDYTVPADQLMTLVLNQNRSCDQVDKGCQKFGKPVFEGIETVTYAEVYLRNDPDKYINVPQAIMCNDDALGCIELVNQGGGIEYYKIEPTKLCTYTNSIVNGHNAEGWFKKGSTESGCGSLPYKNCDLEFCDDVAAEDCLINGGGWSEMYDQCTIIWQDVFAEDICALKDGQWISAADSVYDLNSDSVYDAVCLANPFSIYRANEANKYKGYVGECSYTYHGCTEFVDINPNFITNGSFEFYDQAGRPLYWAVKNATSGSYTIEPNDVRIGSKSIKLIKRTDQECPETTIYPNPGCVLDLSTETLVPTYALQQTVIEVQRGKTYKISFYYKVPLEAKGRGSDCSLPEAHFSLELKETNFEQILDSPSFELTPETEWKKVEVLYNVPTFDDPPLPAAYYCQESPGITGEGECVGNGYNWVPHEIFNLELYLSAPQNINKQATREAGTFVGNCIDSYILYDLVEVKDNTEDSYYVLDVRDSMDRSSCTSVDWDSGCVQFINTVEDVSEIMKVQRDRKCGQWAFCSSHCADEVSATESDCLNAGEEWFPDICTATDLCIEAQGGICTKIAPKNDNVRYSVEGEPIIIKRITDLIKKQGYIYRFGAGSKTRLAQWRAGDYSGYTIVDRLPIEAELTNGQFAYYSHINHLGEFQDERYTQPVCKIFPAEDAPLPYELSLLPDYKNLLNLYSQSESLEAIGNGCFYEKATAEGTNTYFSRDSVGQAKLLTKICTSPEEVKGKVCTEGEKDCISSIGGSSGTCTEIGIVKDFAGYEGMCLEFDLTNPVYGDIYSDFYAGFGEYQPYACLTYYPYNIDICPIHKTAIDCLLNPQCRYSSTQSQCCREADFDGTNCQ